MEPNKEPNWTELLEKEYKDAPCYWRMVEHWRKDGYPDKEIYEILDTWG